jgi:GntP family gluconate:H+ symporter
MDLLTGLSLIVAGILLIILLTSWLKINAFLSLFIVSLLLALVVMPMHDIIPAMKKGFGDTMASIGLIIILGAIIGVTLDFTGATVSMANFIRQRIGKNNASSAISITGFITGLPIFCDSGFIVLSGLNRSLTSRGGLNPVFMSTVLACSLYSVHCLIPPHPGATAAAGLLGANIGQLILLGIVVAIPAAIAAYFWAKFITNRFALKTTVGDTSDREDVPEKDLPPAGRSFMPILIPLLLITGKSMMGYIFPEASPVWIKITGFAGDPVIALFIGMLLSFSLLPVFNRNHVNHILSLSIEKAGPILVVTAAGGIFGAVLKATGTGEQAGNFLSQSGLGLLIPFLLAFILKTAQGSSTIAIITAASIISAMPGNLGFPGESGKLLVMLAMGSGSMIVSHANDSYFWVITNFSQIDSSDTLKVYSTATVVMGLTSLAAVYLLSLVLI